MIKNEPAVCINDECQCLQSSECIELIVDAVPFLEWPYIWFSYKVPLQALETRYSGSEERYSKSASINCLRLLISSSGNIEYSKHSDISSKISLVYVAKTRAFISVESQLHDTPKLAPITSDCWAISSAFFLLLPITISLATHLPRPGICSWAAPIGIDKPIFTNGCELSCTINTFKPLLRICFCDGGTLKTGISLDMGGMDLSNITSFPIIFNSI